MRYFGSCEAAWRPFGFIMFDTSHTVTRLEVHMPDEMHVPYADNEEGEIVPARAANSDERWKTLTYSHFPPKYNFVLKDKKWFAYKILGKPRVGRECSVHPSEGEVFYPRRLLTILTGIEITRVGQ
eukprot:6214656-Pleurochrysis_carterae.AAC.6